MPSQEKIVHQRSLVDLNRRNLPKYLKQQGLLGGEAYVTLAVANGIRTERENILRIKQILRDWNVPVDNHPDDGDNAPITPITEPTRQSVSAQSITVDRVKLRNVLTDYFNDDELRQ